MISNKCSHISTGTNHFKFTLLDTFQTITVKTLSVTELKLIINMFIDFRYNVPTLGPTERIIKGNIYVSTLCRYNIGDGQTKSGR